MKIVPGTFGSRKILSYRSQNVRAFFNALLAKIIFLIITLYLFHVLRYLKVLSFTQFLAHSLSNYAGGTQIVK